MTRLLACLAMAVIGATALSAQWNVPINISFTSPSSLSIIAFETTFPAGQGPESWSIDVTDGNGDGIAVFFTDITRSAGGSPTTFSLAEHQAANPIFVAIAGTSNNPYTTPNYAGSTRRFTMLAIPLGQTAVYPNACTITLVNASGTSTTPVGIPTPPPAFSQAYSPASGTSGTCDAYMVQTRNKIDSQLSYTEIGATGDEIAFDFTVDYGSVGNPTGASLSLWALGTVPATSLGIGSLVVELWDMSADGYGTTPSASVTVDCGFGTEDAVQLLAPANRTGLHRFRLVVRGAATLNGPLACWWQVTFDRTENTQDITANLPGQAAPRMAITPAGQAITSTTTLSCTGGTGSPASYNWAFQGTPPAGVSLSAATGASVDLVVTGSPTGSATVRATNGTTGEFTEETYTFSGGGPVTPSITVAATDASAAEATPATQTGTYTITLSAAAASAVTVNFTMSGTAATASGTDYNLSTLSAGSVLTYTTGPTGTITVPAGQTSVTITLTPVDDAAVESAETAILTIDTGTGYTVGGTPSGTVTIADNDTVGTPVVTVSTTSNAGEPSTNGTFTLTASPVPTGTITVNFTLGGTASVGTDYTASGTTSVQITGSGTATVTVTVVDDATVEGTETVTIQLAAGTGYTLGTPDNASMNITDDDTAGGTLNITTTSLANGTVGSAYPGTVSCTGGTGPYTWSIASGTLPTGLALGTSTTTTVGFTGTPSVANTFNFTIQVSDSTPGLPLSDTQALSITITTGGGGGGGGVGGGGGGGGGGGCAADTGSTWLALLGMFALMALAYRKRRTA